VRGAGAAGVASFPCETDRGLEEQRQVYNLRPEGRCFLFGCNTQRHKVPLRYLKLQGTLQGTL